MLIIPHAQAFTFISLLQVVSVPPVCDPSRGYCAVGGHAMGRLMLFKDHHVLPYHDNGADVWHCLGIHEQVHRSIETANERNTCNDITV